MLSFILLTCLLTLVWAWIGYPLFLALVTRPALRALARGYDSPSSLARGYDSPSIAGDHPSVSILIAAYNEESVIAARLQNLAETDLPPGSEILLGCDGCDDHTVEIAKEWEKTLPELTVLDFDPRRGKPAVLLDLVAQARQEILVFSDANTYFQPDTIARLLEPLLADETVRTSGSEFRVPSSELSNQKQETKNQEPRTRKQENDTIGGTCGRLVFTEPNGGETQENAYWKLETWLKIHESRLDSCLGANGAVYAIRKNLFWQDLPDNTIIDDFVIGMKIREAGTRMLYVTEAVATEETPVKISDEWHRRVRIGMGGYQALGVCRHCLHPRFGFFALAFFSHKVLRWFTPHLMILLAFCTLLGVGIGGGGFVWTVLFAQVVFYGLALLGFALRHHCPGGSGATIENGCTKPNPNYRPAVAPQTKTESDSRAGQNHSTTESFSDGGRVAPASQSPQRRASHPGYFKSISHLTRRIPQLCHYFTAMQLALFIGFLRWCRGIQGGTWKRTKRS